MLPLLAGCCAQILWFQGWYFQYQGAHCSRSRISNHLPPLALQELSTISNCLEETLTVWCWFQWYLGMWRGLSPAKLWNRPIGYIEGPFPRGSCSSSRSSMNFGWWGMISFRAPYGSLPLVRSSWWSVLVRRSSQTNICSLFLRRFALESILSVV